jgi:NADPH-dependent 2,4-dienoyl-CoA reductase/sulfur reductase-like enzyme
MMPKEYAKASSEGRDPVPALEMSLDMIREIRERYIDAAFRCKKAGLCSVFLHGGHANLIGQFSSPYYNKRADEYGGSLENRARFAAEILEGIRKKCGEDFVIEMRISADEMIPGGMHFEETKEYLKLLDGMADIFNVSSGVHTDIDYFMYWSPNMYMPHMINVKYAAELKTILTKSKITAVAGIANLGESEKILSAGWADFCAMARPLMADPEMPRKYAMNAPESVRPCTRCNYCGRRIITSRTVACAVNPLLGREGDLTDGRARKAEKQKRVAVVGAGPGGIQAALTLAERGHKVVVFEKADRVGGNLIAAAAMDLKADMKEYLKYVTKQVQESDAEIRLGEEATADTIRALAPDALVIAVGADPYFPNVPGIGLPHVHWAADADLGKVAVGQRVAIIGGGPVGLESAAAQAADGKNVLILELLPEMPVSVTHGEGQLIKIVGTHGGRILTSRKLTAIESNAVTYVDLETGKDDRYACDTVLIAAGLVPRKALADSLRHAIPETEVYLVGDVASPGMIGDAIRRGFDTAISI